MIATTTFRSESTSGFASDGVGRIQCFQCAVSKRDSGKLHLSNGTTVNDKLALKTGRLGRLLESGADAVRLVDEVYGRALARPPRLEERQAFEDVFREAGPDQRKAVAEDLFWSVLTSREFLFQH